MSIDAYVIFTTSPANGAFPDNDSPVDLKASGLDQKLPLGIIITRPEVVFPISDYSVDLEQTLNLGSQSTGSGAGRVSFNPLSIRRAVDSASPQFLYYSSAGVPFRFVDLLITRSAGSGVPVVSVHYRFGLVAVKTVAWSYDEETPGETITFEYGGLVVGVNRPRPDNLPTWTNIAGWNRVKNIRWNGTDVVSG